MIWLGQTKAADPFACRQFRQIFLFLFIRAIGIDGVHDERALDAHRRAITGVDPLHLAGHKPVAHMIDGGAAVFLWQRGAEKSKGAHFRHDVTVKCLVAVGHEDPRHELFLGVGMGAVANESFFFGELRFKQQGVIPLKAGGAGHG